MPARSDMNDAPVSDQAEIEAIVAAGWPDVLPTSTYDLLKESAERFGAAPALSFFVAADRHRDVKKWSYRQLFAEVTRAANGFSALGVGAGNTVAYLLPNLPETHFVLWGAEAAGVAVAINPLLEPEAISALLTTSGATVLVTLAPFPKSDLYEKAVKAAANASALRHVVLVNPAQHVGGWRKAAVSLIGWNARRQCLPFRAGIAVHDYANLRRSQPAGRLTRGRRIDPDEPSSCFCTGGTTGLPKLAQRTHGSEVANAWMNARMVGTGMVPGTVMFCGLPLFHVNAAMVTGLAAFMAGAHVLIGTPQGYRGAGLIERFWEIAAYHRVAIFSGVPTLFASLLKQPTQGHDLSSLKFAFCGAAPMPADLIRRFESTTGIAILEGYGLTEGTCVSAVNPLGGARHIGSVGLSLPFQNLRALIFDTDGRYLRDAEIAEPGHIAISGPNVFAGYLSAAHNRSIWIDRGDGQKWFDTGDLGRVDAYGYVWLTGRAKDVIIRGGHNIDPAVIEEALQTHPAVALAAAVGRPDAHAGEVPVAYVQLHSGEAATEAELLAHATGLIPERAAWPKAVLTVDALPLTAIGKTFKPALKEREIEWVIRQIMAELGIIGRVSFRRETNQATAAIVHVPGEALSNMVDALGRFSFPFDIQPVAGEA